MNYKLNLTDKEKAIKKFGEEFIISVEQKIAIFAERWEIEELNLINSFSVNLVFKGVSKTHGAIVIKFGKDKSELINEVKALNYFSGDHICKLIDVDYDNIVLLEECVQPGTELVVEKDIDRRLDAFCEIYKSLHEREDIDDDEYEFQSYKDWIFNITKYMEQQEEWQEITAHMKRAKELYIELADQYPNKSLLHGDFHYYNILKSETGYKIIDPKGVIGNPIFDIPRYILNEYWDEKDRSKVDKTIEKVFCVISSKLDVPINILRKLLYIEGTMALCWFVESGMPIEKKEETLLALKKFQDYI